MYMFTRMYAHAQRTFCNRDPCAATFCLLISLGIRDIRYRVNDPVNNVEDEESHWEQLSRYFVDFPCLVFALWVDLFGRLSSVRVRVLYYVHLHGQKRANRGKYIYTKYINYLPLTLYIYKCIYNIHTLGLLSTCKPKQTAF